MERATRSPTRWAPSAPLKFAPLPDKPASDGRGDPGPPDGCQRSGCGLGLPAIDEEAVDARPGSADVGAERSGIVQLFRDR
jgi:hypothetical protein